MPFVNCQFKYLVISLLVLRAGCWIWLYQFLIIAYLFTFFILPAYLYLIVFAVHTGTSYLWKLDIEPCFSFVPWKNDMRKMEKRSKGSVLCKSCMLHKICSSSNHVLQAIKQILTYVINIKCLHEAWPWSETCTLPADAYMGQVWTEIQVMLEMTNEPFDLLWSMLWLRWVIATILAGKCCTDECNLV